VNCGVTRRFAIFARNTLGKKATILVVSGNVASTNAMECLASLKANTPPELVRELIVKEAGVRPDFNHAAEINKVMRLFKGDYLVLVDDDVVLDPGWLEGLIGCAERYAGAGVVGAVLRNRNGEIIHTGADVTDTYFGIELKEPVSAPVERKYVCSAVMLMTRAATEKIGLFDEGFRKYGQDADYCLRAWEAGFKVVVSPDAKAVHCVGGTVALRPDMKSLFDRDRKKFYAKWRHSPVYNRFDVIDLTRRGVVYPAAVCKAKQRPLEEILCEMDEIVNRYHLKYVDIAGNEPMAYEHVRELVAYCGAVGVLPTIIIDGQNTQGYADLINAGLEDILISVHGGERGEDGRAAGGKVAFDRFRRAIEVFKDKQFGFRTTSTLINFNYKSLPKLAATLVAMGPRIADFICGNILECTLWPTMGTIDFHARYADVAPYLKEAIDRLTDASIWTNARYFPLCMLKGYEPHVCNFHQGQWDPYERDYFQALKLDRKGMKKVRRGTENESLYGIWLEERMKLWITKHLICTKNVFFKQCSRCANRAICDGVHPRYARRFGPAEFVPLEGALLRDPLYHRKKNQAWRMMKPGRATGA
jgi:hypothetical protein